MVVGQGERHDPAGVIAALVSQSQLSSSYNRAGVGDSLATCRQLNLQEVIPMTIQRGLNTILLINYNDDEFESF